MLRYFTGFEHLNHRFPVRLFDQHQRLLLIGFVLEYLNHHLGANPAWRYAVAIRFIGSFSTFEWDTWSELTRGTYWMGVLYVATSLIVGFITVSLGTSGARSR